MSSWGLGDHEATPVHYPPAPDGLTVYAVGDIHGRLDLLLAAQRQIDEDIAEHKARDGGKRTQEVYLGDYIDRGPSPAAVVSRLIERAQHVETIFLRGNHEQLLLELLHGADCLGDWLAVGGTTTLLSYGVAPGLLSRSVSAEVMRRQLVAVLPPRHLRFYEDTVAYSRIGPYVAVHAGLRPGVALEEQALDDLLSIRRDFLQFPGDLGSIVVHGHTPVAAPDLRPNRINIDTGAFATNRLTILKIDADGARVMPQPASAK
jgi:serine/threonine protein phosphatase 1